MTTPTTVNVQFQLRADTAANWTAANPTLLVNEFALETDTKKLKVGNGNSAWNSLAYFPSIVSGGTVLGNLEIGSTGTLTFEGSTADGFETTLAVTNPTADRTITLPNQSGTVVVSGNASIVDADIAAGAEIAVSKLANGTANQVIVTDGTNVSWSDDLTLAGNLTVNGTTTTINTQDLLVEDKNIIIGNVDTPTDVTADGGGITLKGATDKTINWVDATDSWTSSEHIELASGKSYRINGAEVLNATTLGSGVTSSSLTSVGTLGSVTVTGDATAGTFIPTGGTAPSNGLYLPAANSVALSTNGTEKLRITSAGLVGIGTSSPGAGLHIVSPGQTTSALNTAGDLNTIISDTGVSAGNGGSLVFAAASGQWRFASIKGLVTNGSNNTQGDIVFSTRQNTTDSALTERVRLDSQGRVGIGTTSPAFPLQVTGTISTAPAASNSGFLLLSGNSGATAGCTIESSFTTGGYGPLVFKTSGTERARIDSSGRLLVGTSSALASAFGTLSPRLQVATTTSGPVSFLSYANDAFASRLDLSKSRGTTVGTNTVVINGDDLGDIYFNGADGTNFIPAALIRCEVDGTPGANDMPGRLVFSTTADGASSPTERMRIDNAGTCGFFATGATAIRAGVSSAAGTAVPIYVGRHSSTSTTTGTNSFIVWSNGDVNNTNNVYASISDIKLKENIIDANSQWDDVKALQVRNYNFKEGQTHTQIGLVAQEVELVSPGLVSESPDHDAEGNDLGTVTKSVNYSVLYMKAVKALQEAMERIETLEQRLNDAGIN